MFNGKGNAMVLAVQVETKQGDGVRSQERARHDVLLWPWITWCCGLSVVDAFEMKLEV